jgi:hypothetical protein
MSTQAEKNGKRVMKPQLKGARNYAGISSQGKKKIMKYIRPRSQRPSISEVDLYALL